MLGVDLVGSRRIVWMIIGMIKGHPTKHRMRLLGHFPLVSTDRQQLSSWTTALQNAGMLITTPSPDPPPSRS